MEKFTETHQRNLAEVALESQAAAAFRATAYSSLNQVKCEFRDGVVMLRGSVATFYLKQLAQEVVRKLDGVKFVENRIDVLAASHSGDEEV